jgi:hypothetical protein
MCPGAEEKSEGNGVCVKRNCFLHMGGTLYVSFSNGFLTLTYYFHLINNKFRILIRNLSFSGIIDQLKVNVFPFRHKLSACEESR